MHIAVDMDDVILDFTGGVIDAVNLEYAPSPPLTVDDVKDWHIGEVLNPIIGYSWWRWMRKRSWLWSNFPAVPGAIGYLERLRSDGHYLEVVTSKPEWAEANVWQWLGKWKPPVQRVTIVNDSVEKVEATTAEVLVDDKFENVKAFADAARHAVLFTRSHNRHAPRYPGVARTSGWEDTYVHLDWLSG